MRKAEERGRPRKGMEPWRCKSGQAGKWEDEVRVEVQY